MKDASRVLLGAWLLAAGLATAGAADAQESAWHPLLSTSVVLDGDADLDGGGDFSVGRMFLRAGAAREFGDGNRVGVTFNYDYNDYSFSDPADFGGDGPWNIVQRYGISVPLAIALREDWTLGVIPSVDWFRENGADTGDSLSWGATFTAVRRFEGGNRFGLGVTAFEQIEETNVFPVVVVDWRLGERWRLSNPLPSGPMGPAGLELDREFDGGWAVGVGVAYRILRFRLSDDGPVPNGVGEESGTPVFLLATRNFDERIALHLYAGLLMGGELRVEDPSGDLLVKDEFDAVPLVGIAFTGRF